MSVIQNEGSAEHLPERPLRVAIIGTRGIPARYGGFETFAEELSVRLVGSGFEPTVYTRPHVTGSSARVYRGVELIPLPSIRQKYLETITHSALSLLHAAIFGRFDAVLVCNAANSPFVWISRLFGIPTAINVDGIERKRAKWNSFGRLWYLLGERCSVLFASELISDADVIQDYYRTRYGADSTVLRYGFREVYGAEREAKSRGEKLVSPERFSIFKELKIVPGQYLLYVSRLEPENHAHTVIKAYNTLSGPKPPLVIVGDAPYAEGYKQSLKDEAGDGVILAGYRFDESYFALQLGATLYIQATEVGGTHPALVESMGFGNCVIANDTPEHREVLGEEGIYYEKNSVSSLATKLRYVLDDGALLLRLRERNYRRAVETLSWDAVTAGYKALFRRLTTKKNAA